MKVAAAALCVLLTASLAGQVPRPKMPVLGAGTTPCSQWLANVKDLPGGGVQIGPQDPVLLSWILGYVSAAGPTGSAADTDGASWVQGFITGECQHQPSETLDVAAAALVTFLRTHEGR